MITKNTEIYYYLLKTWFPSTMKGLHLTNQPSNFKLDIFNVIECFKYIN